MEAWSTQSPGFGIRIMAPKSKGGAVKRTWIVRYNGERKNQKQNLKTKFDPTSASFKAARLDAEAVRAQALTDRDKEGAWTLDQAWENYKAMRPLAPDSITSYQQSLRLIPQDLRNRPMDKLTDDDFNALYLRIAQANRRPSAKLMLRVAHMLYQREIAKKHVDDNPITSIAADIKLYERAQPKAQDEDDDDLYYVPPEQLPAVWAIMEGLHPSVRDYLRVILFTGWRKSIAGGLEWASLDREEHTYLIHARQRGSKKKIAIKYPISDAMWEFVIAPRIAANQEGKWILPSNARAGRPLHYPTGAFDYIELKTGIRISAHRLRYTCATIADAVLDYNLVLVGRILMHSPKLTRQETMSNRYVAKRSDPFRAGVNKLGNAILEYAGVRKAGEVPPVPVAEPAAAATPLPEQYPDLRDLAEA